MSDIDNLQEGDNKKEEDKITENQEASSSVNNISRSYSANISDLKIQHFKEITELRNQLDEVRTRATIIETTKQDELDEMSSKTSQEIDSLNHIINALQNDLSQLRNEYENLSSNYKELKRQHQNMYNNIQQHQSDVKSPIHSSTATSNSGSQSSGNVATTHHASSSRIILSPFGSHSHNNQQQQLNHHHISHNSSNISQENENLEEDMRKAKESADMLRSVVLPLETEINTLRSRSNTSDRRIQELEQIIEQNEKEKKEIMEQEKKVIDELELQDEDSCKDQEINVLAKKYVQLKQYLKKCEKKFIELEQTNLKAIRQIFLMLTQEQKLNLIPNRPKSKSFLLNQTNKSAPKKSNSLADEEKTNEEKELDIEKNETISKIEELLNNLTTSTTTAEPNMTSDNQQQQQQIYSYAELIAMYEREKDCRIDLESNYQQKAKESNRQVENLNREMSNLASIIEDLRKQYVTLQNQYQFQIDSLIKLNEELRSDMNQVEIRNEKYKAENLRLKAENKQFYGEQTMISKELDETYQSTNNLDEANKQIASLRSEMVKLVLANQALNKQINLSSESIKHLQKLNLQYQRSNSMQDQMVITQSLESELERERKVRLEAENDKNEAITQLKVIKDKGQTLVESLKHRNEQNEFEIKKLKEDNQELTNQIAALKKDSKNNLSVQEDLVRLIQSLQIELNQVKAQNEPTKGMADGSNRSTIEVRCQNEDDFNDCASCKCIFSVTKRKHRCKHCCKIFCAECCAKTVLSGPNLRPHKVCNSCHTLLDKDSRPSSSSSSATHTSTAASNNNSS